MQEIYAALAPLLALTAYAAMDPQLEKTIGLAWDCGAVTTGPVTVPLVLLVLVFQRRIVAGLTAGAVKA